MISKGHQQPTFTWAKGWTPWGTPCSVLIIDGRIKDANSTESQHCACTRLVDPDLANFTPDDSSATSK